MRAKKGAETSLDLHASIGRKEKVYELYILLIIIGEEEGPEALPLVSMSLAKIWLVHSFSVSCS